MLSDLAQVVLGRNRRPTAIVAHRIAAAVFFWGEICLFSVCYGISNACDS
jgi:hypothetical protein